MSKDFTNANRVFFDNLASNYDTKPWQHTLSAQLTTALTHNLAFIGADWITPTDPLSTSTSSPTNPTAKPPQRTLKLLDYACGTGTVSRALSPHLTHATGLDISLAMVSRYNALAADSKQPCQMHALVGDLLSDALLSDAGASGEVGADWGVGEFDVVAVGLGFHHFHDAGDAVGRLAARLRRGGVLLVVDFVAHGHGHGHGHDESQHAGQSHGEHAHNSSQHSPTQPTGHTHDGFFGGHAGAAFPGQHTVKRHGFGEGDVKAMFEGAGLAGFGWWEMEEAVVLRMDEARPVERRVFFARGSKV